MTNTKDRAVFIGESLSLTCAREFFGDPGNVCECCGRSQQMLDIERLSGNGGWSHVLLICEDDFPRLVQLVERVSAFLQSHAGEKVMSR